MAALDTKIDVYPHGTYVMTETESCRKHKDQTPAARLSRMKERFDKYGVIRSVEAVMLVHLHGHPHVLLLESQLGQATVYRLPGGKCRSDEDVRECLKRKLIKKVFHDAEDAPFRVGDLLATWTRPNFDPLMYPYKPVHITKEKELRDVYLVHLEPEATMRVPKDARLVAVPLFELFDNAARFGNVIASVPQVISRLQVNLC